MNDQEKVKALTYYIEWLVPLLLTIPLLAMPIVSIQPINPFTTTTNVIITYLISSLFVRFTLRLFLWYWEGRVAHTKDLKGRGIQR